MLKVMAMSEYQWQVVMDNLMGVILVKQVHGVISIGIMIALMNQQEIWTLRYFHH